MTAEELLSRRDGRPLKVLIVDDEEHIRNVFRDFCLSSPLFAVTTAAGGEEAIHIVEKNDFDLVTIDLVMPEVSGIDAIETIRRQKPHLPVVIVTGNATERLISEAGRFGGCRVLRKPIGIEQFLEELVDIAGDKCR
jgi:two-component system chemotaxis response regulator CheY